MTLWYPRYMLQYRVALFEGGATLAGSPVFMFHDLVRVDTQSMQVHSRDCLRMVSHSCPVPLVYWGGLGSSSVTWVFTPVHF